MKTWLVLDGNNLAHRAYHSTGMLSFGENPTGVYYGFLREVISLSHQHNTNNFVFCFDCGKSKRCKLFPEYKEKRHKDKTQEEQEQYIILRKQIQKLRRRILPEIGFNNVFWEKGYEADDLIASFVKHNLDPKDTAIIVSGDHDLYQVLSKKRVIIWKSQQKVPYTEKCLAKEFNGIEPSRWHCVKAISGCSSDGIPGIKGVGEIKASQYLTGLLTKGKAFEAIETNQELINRNLELVKLPFPNTPKLVLKKDEVTVKKWKVFLKTYGITSIKDFLWQKPS